MAYRKAEEHRNMTLDRRLKKSINKEKSCKRCYTLDRDFLLQHHGVAEPSELWTVNISELELNNVKAEDLKAFNNVALVDASINSLSLGSFSSFVSLRELNLAVNGLCHVTFDGADFPHLQVLDLSYNCLSADVVVSFGRLPLLKVLHLTGNELCHLPPHLGAQQPDPHSHLCCGDQFNALEVLMLDDNKLSSEVFSSLSNLKRLKHLNLQRNRITQIPYLKLMTSCIKTMQTPSQGERHTLAKQKSLNTMSQESDFLRELLSPLPELQFLDLSHNKIAKEEVLLPAAVFPKLREIDIRSNPITTKKCGKNKNNVSGVSNGDPPLLTYYLQEKMGITVTRKDVCRAAKHGLRMSASPYWKAVEVSNKPLLMHQHCPALIQSKEGAVTVRSKGNLNIDGHFFQTEANISEDDQTSMRHKDKATPERFSLSKKKIDAKSNPDVVRPVGIQTAVQMLENTLKNLNIYRDTKPKLDGIQTPHRQRLERIRELTPLRPRPGELQDEMIKDLRQWPMKKH
uniref:X-ray radiation resistance-associated protein 1 n=1 Tax=Doryrhamphus excisus TaxID=161450 RepID=UPI0025AEB362|nr:X-ray radiation resistance-associated protein 1 [Doryrhamphus excisus]